MRPTPKKKNTSCASCGLHSYDYALCEGGFIQLTIDEIGGEIGGEIDGFDDLLSCTGTGQLRFLMRSVCLMFLGVTWYAGLVYTPIRHR